MMSRQTDETRERIVKAALDLLEQGRGSATRMTDIAKAAGISRQAVYLHFPTRADLLIAATRYLDWVNRIDDRLAASRAARSGVERLDAFIDAWGHYIPNIYGVARALLAMKDHDAAAAAAWDERMAAVRHGCQAAIDALAADRALAPDLPEGEATDLLWALLSVRTWEQLTQQCGWPQDRYIVRIKALARAALVAAGR